MFAIKIRNFTPEIKKAATYIYEISYRNTEFDNIIEEGYVYIDKTKLVYDLAINTDKIQSNN